MIERRLGSTEIAAVAAYYLPTLAAELPKDFNVSDVYARLKWGLQKPKKKTMDRGNRVEPAALEYYEKHIGSWFRPVPFHEFWTVPHPSNEWFTASPDAWDSPDGRIVIEAKSWNDSWGRKFWGTPGTDEVATRYVYQCDWLMACCDAEKAVVVVMFGHDLPGGEFQFTEPAVYPLNRDEKREAFLLGCGECFIEEFVRPGIPPPVKSAHNRREFRKRLEDESGFNAVADWEARCIAHAAQLGAKAGGGDGAARDHSEERLQQVP
jgi:hypothetical protein